MKLHKKKESCIKYNSKKNRIEYKKKQDDNHNRKKSKKNILNRKVNKKISKKGGAIEDLMNELQNSNPNYQPESSFSKGNINLGQKPPNSKQGSLEHNCEHIKKHPSFSELNKNYKDILCNYSLETQLSEIKEIKKYSKMIKYGIPRNTVKSNMTADKVEDFFDSLDNLDDTVEAFLDKLNNNEEEKKQTQTINIPVSCSCIKDTPIEFKFGPWSIDSLSPENIQGTIFEKLCPTGQQGGYRVRYQSKKKNKKVNKDRSFRVIRSQMKGGDNILNTIGRLFTDLKNQDFANVESDDESDDESDSNKDVHSSSVKDDLNSKIPSGDRQSQVSDELPPEKVKMKDFIKMKLGEIDKKKMENSVRKAFQNDRVSVQGMSAKNNTEIGENAIWTVLSVEEKLNISILLKSLKKALESLQINTKEKLEDILTVKACISLKNNFWSDGDTYFDRLFEVHKLFEKLIDKENKEERSNKRLMFCNPASGTSSTTNEAFNYDIICCTIVNKKNEIIQCNAIQNFNKFYKQIKTDLDKIKVQMENFLKKPKESDKHFLAPILRIILDIKNIKRDGANREIVYGFYLEKLTRLETTKIDKIPLIEIIKYLIPDYTKKFFPGEDSPSNVAANFLTSWGVSEERDLIDPSIILSSRQSLEEYFKTIKSIHIEDKDITILQDRCKTNMETIISDIDEQQKLATEILTYLPYSENKKSLDKSLEEVYDLMKKTLNFCLALK